MLAADKFRINELLLYFSFFLCFSFFFSKPLVRYNTNRQTLLKAKLKLIKKRDLTVHHTAFKNNDVGYLHNVV